MRMYIGKMLTVAQLLSREVKLDKIYSLVPRVIRQIESLMFAAEWELGSKIGGKDLKSLYLKATFQIQTIHATQFAQLNPEDSKERLMETLALQFKQHKRSQEMIIEMRKRLLSYFRGVSTSHHYTTHAHMTYPAWTLSTFRTHFRRRTPYQQSHQAFPGRRQPIHSIPPIISQ